MLSAWGHKEMMAEVGLRTQNSSPWQCTSLAYTAPGKLCQNNTAELLMHIVGQRCCEHRMCFIPTDYLGIPTVYYARSLSHLTTVSFSRYSVLFQ